MKNILLLISILLSATIYSQNCDCVGSTALRKITGTANPNGNVTAVPGEIYQQKISQTSGTFWVKKTGNNTKTGWAEMGTAGTGWSLTGNAGTNPSNNFIGTTDGLPLKLKAQSSINMFTDGGLYLTDYGDNYDYFKVTPFKVRLANIPIIETQTDSFTDIGSVGYRFKDVYSTKGYFGTGGQNISQGTFDNGTGGNKGISLNCAVGYELNWQGGHLSSSYNNGTTFYPVIVDTALQVNGSLEVFTNSSFTVADSANNVDKFLVDVENNQSEFKTSLRIKDGTEGAGKVFTSDSAGYGSWQGGIIYDSLTSLTGETVTLTNNSTYIIAASGTVVSVTWSFPTGNTGDVLDIENMQVITTLNITGTGTGTITAAKITNSKTAGLKTFHNYGGNWY